MRVAILHFHLRAGGVTRVIEMAHESLQNTGHEVLVISGEPVPIGCRLDPAGVEVVPELAYDVSASRWEELCSAVDAAMHRRWGAVADVLHFHNHSLGKNFALPLAVSRWAGEGRDLLLQVHDFAENGRPANYRRLLSELGGEAGLGACLYPVAPHVAYALLNSADQTRLRSAGLEGASVLLPNPVALPQGDGPVRPEELQAERLIVYPTRAIRRKNLGEALLWATQVGAGEKVVLTAAPVGAADLARMEEWRTFAESLRLPVIFDAQALLCRPTVDFLRGADLCLTTSVAEGFGMAFLEPWLADCPLAGRDLPGITADFRRTGLRFDGLYERLDIPVAFAGDVEAMIRTVLERLGQAYGFPVEGKDIQSSLSSVLRNGQVDFGRLDESAQRRIIADVAQGRLTWTSGLTKRPAENRDLIEQHYSLAAYGQRLDGLYRLIAAQTPGSVEYLESARVLRANLPFDDFFALRS